MAHGCTGMGASCVATFHLKREKRTHTMTMNLTSTTNGFDARWVEVINQVLEDRELDFRIKDIAPQFWETWIGKMCDDLEEGTTGEPNPEWLSGDDHCMIVPASEVGNMLTWVCVGKCKTTFFTADDDAGTPDSEGCGEAVCFKCLDENRGRCPNCNGVIFPIRGTFRLRVSVLNEPISDNEIDINEFLSEERNHYIDALAVSQLEISGRPLTIGTNEDIRRVADREVVEL